MIGWGEFVLILILTLIFLGPEKITEFARELGKLYAEYKKARRMIELEVLYGEKIKEDIEEKYSEFKIEDPSKGPLQ